MGVYCLTSVVHSNSVVQNKIYFAIYFIVYVKKIYWSQEDFHGNMFYTQKVL